MADRELTPDRKAPPIVQARDAAEAIAGAKHSYGTITFAANPSDGDYVTLDDGVNPALTFEFDDDSSITDGNVSVTIGVNAAATMATLITTINEIHTVHTRANTDLYIEATAVAGSDACTLKHRVAGTAGNVTVTKSGANISVTGMTGGLNPNMANTAYYGYNEVIAAHSGYVTNDFDIEGDLGCKATVFKISTDDDLVVCFNGETSNPVYVSAAESPWVLSLNELEIARVQIQHYQSGAGDASVQMFVSGRG